MNLFCSAALPLFDARFKGFFKPSSRILCVVDTALAVQRPLQEPRCIFPSSERAAGCAVVGSTASYTVSIAVVRAVIPSVHKVQSQF